MASKIEGKHFNVSIKAYEYAGQKFDTLRVSTTYRKGYGFSAYYTPGWNTNCGFGCILMGSGDPLESSQWVDIQPADKNSQKTINEMGAALELAKDVIRALFDKREWTMLNNVIHNVAKCGYTESFRAQAEKYLNENKTDENINPKNEEEKVMANETLKAADLIGKKIVLKNTNNYYEVLAVDGEVVMTKFHMGENVREVPISWTNVQSFIASGVYVIEGMEGAAKATDEVEEVQDVNPTKPEPKVEPKDKKPTAKKSEPKPKAEQPMTGDSPLTGDRYTCVPYTTSKGKTGAKIYGVTEADAAYQQAGSIHAAAGAELLGGRKKFYLIFGPRYATAAREVCAALNAGKPIANLQAIVNAATEALAQAKADSKTYTKAEVIALMKRAVAGDKDALEFMNAA